ncbi:zinc-dependent alcohol dehydrogenase [Caenispirillum salinarum]|uniref:zinc-dependent alcohol dehydrogenase n=1 Tax=Caenispirillum salinarum TaxID=859058 RepID=UPI00384B306A
MRALCWNGINDLRVETVEDPKILDPGDVIVKVTLSSVCGSDLHLLDGYVPAMRSGDVLGHEFLGEVVETGSGVSKFTKGDRVIVISIIGCGHCWFCDNQLYSLCDNSNATPGMEETVYGHAGAGIFGYSHAFGGYAGSHADYIRVPYAETNVFKVPDGVPDETAVFVSDAVPTGWMAADLADIQGGDVVAVWGAGGVGLMAMTAARIMGAERVIAIDRFPDRLRKAHAHAGADILNYEKVDVHDALMEMTGGRGPDRCIDAVGLEAHGTGPGYLYDRAKQALQLETGRATVLRQAVRACRKGGTVSVIGVYGGFVDTFPIGALMNKALTMRGGQQHGQRYVPTLFEHIREGRLDPAYLMTHRWPLERGAEGYGMFKHKTDDCLRVVFDPSVRPEPGAGAGVGANNTTMGGPA